MELKIYLQILWGNFKRKSLKSKTRILVRLLSFAGFAFVKRTSWQLIPLMTTLGAMCCAFDDLRFPVECWRRFSLIAGVNCCLSYPMVSRVKEGSLWLASVFLPIDLPEWQLFLTALLQLDKYNLHFSRSLSLWHFSSGCSFQSQFSLHYVPITILEGAWKIGRELYYLDEIMQRDLCEAQSSSSQEFKQSSL